MAEQRPIIDILTNLGRVEGQSRMIPEDKDVVAITEAEAAQVIHRVELYVKAKQLSRKDVGRDIGYSAPRISEVLSQTYAGNWRRIIRDLDDWLNNRLEADKVSKTTTFTWTRVAMEIQTVARISQRNNTIGLVYGPDSSGVGKTMALQALHAQIAGSIMITCDTIHANPTGVLRAIAEALGISHAASNHTLSERIVGELKGTSRMLFVDQVHKLCGYKGRGDRPLFILTEIWDATEAPQLWAGTTDIKMYLERGEARGDEPLAQIRSRIAYVRDLLRRTRPTQHGGHGDPLFTIQDIRAAFGRNKVKVSDEGIKFLWKLACIPNGGALRLCANIVRIATIIADSESAPSLGMNDLVAALQESMTSANYTQIAAEMTASGIRMAAAG